MTAEINVIKFIRRIKEHRMLWDFTHPENKNVREKTLVWRELSKEFGVNVEVLKKRWKWLRDSYARERNKDKKANAKGSESSWRYWKYLQFLEGHFKIRSALISEDTMQMKKLDDEDDDYTMTLEHDRVPSTSQSETKIEICPAYSETEIDPLVPHSQADEYLRAPESFKNFGTVTVKSTEINKRREREASVNQHIEEGLLGAMGSIQNYVKKLHDTASAADASDDEDELFCKSIAKKIKKFPLRTKNEVKVHMLSYLNEMECSLEVQNQQLGQLI